MPSDRRSDTVRVGGILVFLTGQNEIVQLCNRLRKRYCKSQAEEERRKIKAIRRRPREDRVDPSSKEEKVREHDDDEEAADLEDAMVRFANLSSLNMSQVPNLSLMVCFQASRG